MDSVVVTVSQPIPNLEERLFVKGFAIDDYPVHVKDDGFELSGLHKYELQAKHLVFKSFQNFHGAIGIPSELIM